VKAKERIERATFHATYGKWTFAKKTAVEIAWCVHEPEYSGLMKGVLLHLAINNPKVLREVANERCRFERDREKPLRHKCPHGHDLIWAYAACASARPTFREVKQAFIAKFGKKKWNGGNEDERTAGDASARKTLKILGLPLKEMKKGRPTGAKSLIHRK